MKLKGNLALLCLAAALTAPTGANAFPGDIYEADSGSGKIFKFAPDGTKAPFATGLNSVGGLVLDNKGNVYVGDFVSGSSGTGKIYKFTRAGVRTTFASGLDAPQGLAFDGFGYLYVADLPGVIYKFNPAGVRTTFASNLNQPIGIAFDRAGNLYEADRGNNLIYKFAPDGTRGDPAFASNLSGPSGLAFDASGNLFVTNAGNGELTKITPAGVKSFYSNGYGPPIGIAITPDFIYIGEGGNNWITKTFVQNGSILQTLFAGGLSGPFFLAVEPSPHFLINISARAFVGTGDDALITGFIVGGNGQINDIVLVRGIGPSLSAFGVTGTLQNPQVKLYDASGTVIAANDDWKDSQQSQIQATGLAPSDDRESAILAFLPAGNYTGILRGANASIGRGLFEVYNVQP